MPRPRPQMAAWSANRAMATMPHPPPPPRRAKVGAKALPIRRPSALAQVVHLRARSMARAKVCIARLSIIHATVRARVRARKRDVTRPTLTRHTTPTPYLTRPAHATPRHTHATTRHAHAHAAPTPTPCHATPRPCPRRTPTHTPRPTGDGEHAQARSHRCIIRLDSLTAATAAMTRTAATAAMCGEGRWRRG